MTSAGDPGPSIGELSRQVQGVLIRVESVVSKLENQYVRNDIYKLWQESMQNRIAILEDTNKWLIRLIIGAVIIGVLGAVFSVSGGN